MLVCEGMAGEPVEELGSRTPLELAKIPNINFLAKKGRVGRASFIPHSLAATADVAALSLLGFDPQEFYTGIAPLEAAAMGIPQDDTEIAFRCDLVTVLDDVLVDTSASHISPNESRLLVEELNKKLSNDKLRFYPGEGHKNILLIRDAEKADRLDELECASPKSLIGKSFAKHLPKGEEASLLRDLMDRSREILENHEINRVRIDLGENPANRIWPWGQGKRPKMPAFEQRFGIRGSVVSQTDFVVGLGKLLGLQMAENIETCLNNGEFAFMYKDAGEAGLIKNNLKSKIKLIEEFDSKIISQAVKLAERFKDLKILIATDQGQAAFLLSGYGIKPEEASGLNEKSASQSKLVFEEGHQLMEFFLRK